MTPLGVTALRPLLGAPSSWICRGRFSGDADMTPVEVLAVRLSGIPAARCRILSPMRFAVIPALVGEE